MILWSQHMAIPPTCCLNLTPPRFSTSATGDPKAASSFRNDDWRRKCVVAAACMVIGVQIGEGLAMAKDMDLNTVESKLLGVGNRKEPRWSDNRVCDPWHLNSLEIIVPENLPRPAARRRWEAVGQDHNNRPLPPTQAAAAAAADALVKGFWKGCFSL